MTQTRPRPLYDAVMANRRLLIMAFAFSAAMSLLALTTSFYMLQVYDRVLTSRSFETLVLLTLIAFSAIGVFGWLDSLRLRLVQRIALRTADALGKRVLRAMVSSASQTGGSISRNGLRDLETVKNFIGSPAVSTLMDAPFTVVFLLVLLALHWALLLIVLVGGGILILLALLGQRVTNATLVQSIELQARTHNFAEDGLRNADVLEGMGMSQTFVDRWHEQWISSMRKSSISADRDSKLTSMSRAVRLLDPDFPARRRRAPHPRPAGDGRHHDRGLDHRRARPGADRSRRRDLEELSSRRRLAWVRLDEILNTAPRRDEGMALPAPKGRLSAQRAGFVHPADAQDDPRQRLVRAAAGRVRSA